MMSIGSRANYSEHGRSGEACAMTQAVVYDSHWSSLRYNTFHALFMYCTFDRQKPTTDQIQA